jgi:hypothetical protein
MKFYDNLNGLIIISLLFISTMLFMGYMCPCDNDKNNRCMRHEVYGVQFNHLIFCIFLGFYFPSYIFLLIIISTLWELLEYYMDKYEKFVMKNIGGCLMKNPNNKPNYIYDYIVYKDEPKYLNPIDQFFGIKNSLKHGWHGSVAETLLNYIGLYIGYQINKKYY